MPFCPAVAKIIYSDNQKNIHQNQINGPMTTNSFPCLLKNVLIIDFDQLNEVLLTAARRRFGHLSQDFPTLVIATIDKNAIIFPALASKVII